MITYARAPMMRYPQKLSDTLRAGVATIGNFDGIHRGHQRVLKQVREIAGDRPAIVISFYPHPIRVLRPEAGLRYISSVREKAERCGALGVDLLYFVHFTQTISEMSATDFIQKILVGALSISELVVGEDVRIGKNREGDLAFLQKTLPAYGITLHTVPKLDIDGVKAGSRKIRELIEQGAVAEAQELIGEPFTISARVGHGDKRGSLLGFPTANIAVGSRLIPRRGVYACKVTIEDKCFAAVANIGIRPTFNGTGERLEVHILDFPPRSLYGIRMHVGFVARLREEKRFDSIEALKAQIADDVKSARERLGHVS
jgi:riboflavin kinase/FMN adenylyltransferase